MLAVGQRQQRVEVDLEVGDALADAVGLEHRGVDLADLADLDVADHDPSAPAWGAGPGARAFSTRAPSTPRASATRSPELHGLRGVAAGQHRAEALALVGQLGATDRRHGGTRGRSRTARTPWLRCDQL